MNNNSIPQYDYKWNSRMISLYWYCNLIVLLVEIIICVLAFQNHTVNLPDLPNLPQYIISFIIIPSGLILLFTVLCQFAVYKLSNNNGFICPYIIASTGVAFCTVLLVVHYSLAIIHLLFIMPVFFSLVYNNKKVVLFTFLASTAVFIVVYFVYYSMADLPLLTIDIMEFANLMSNVAILFVAYLICGIILKRFDEIINRLASVERAAYESKIAKEQAEAAAEARARFLAIMSHEMRTPMNGVMGLTELALEDKTLTRRQKDYLLKIKNSADGLLEIINRVLDLSKIDAGQLSLETIAFRLSSVIKECENMISCKAQEKGLALYVFDETMLDCEITGDPTRLRQALLNLLSNAVKFTKDGSVTFTVKRVEDNTENSQVSVYFEISDTGIGIADFQQEKIFDPFKQADDSTTRSFGGTGLGLSITKNIVEKMGGTIGVISEPNKGSIFHFTLPFGIYNVKTESPDSKLINNEKYPLFEGRVLICEDNKINRQIAKESFERLGLKAVLAENGRIGAEKALKSLEAGAPFDIIFMDIHMPEMDGLEAARMLVEKGIKAPIIAMTANVLASDREKYFRAGMKYCIYKPFKQSELQKCLLKFLPEAGYQDNINSGGNENTLKPNTIKQDYPPAIDTALGLSYAADNEELYKKILASFFEEQPRRLVNIEKAINANDFRLARDLAHTAKSVAETVGATKLSEYLAEVESEAVKEAVMADSIVMENYKSELLRVLKYISDNKG